MRVDSPAEHWEEVSVEPKHHIAIEELQMYSTDIRNNKIKYIPFVHVSGHLVEDEPVPLGAVLDVVVDVTIILILLEVSPHFPFYQQVPS